MAPIVLRRLCDWGNCAGHVNVDVKDTCTGCDDADGNIAGDNNDPNDDTAVGIEGVWAEDKVIDVCKVKIWYGAPLCELDAIVVCSNSPPRIKHGYLPTVKFQRSLKYLYNDGKEICVNV